MNTPLGVNYLYLRNKKGLTPQMIAMAAAKHFERFGCEARVCYARRIKGIEANGLQIKQADNVPAGQVWLGRE